MMVCTWPRVNTCESVWVLFKQAVLSSSLPYLSQNSSLKVQNRSHYFSVLSNTTYKQHQWTTCIHVTKCFFFKCMHGRSFFFCCTEGLFWFLDCFKYCSLTVWWTNKTCSQEYAQACLTPLTLSTDWKQPPADKPRRPLRGSDKHTCAARYASVPHHSPAVLYFP